MSEGAGVDSLFFLLCLFVVEGFGALDLGVQIWAVGFDLAMPELLRLEQGEEMSVAIPSNKGWAACCLPGSAVVALPRLPPADRGGEGMKMVRAVLSRVGGGGSASTAARGRGTARWLHSSSSSTPSPAGRGGEGSWGPLVRSVACSLFLKRVH
jgi:hypothetical protein